jgi:hypothetical protein
MAEPTLIAYQQSDWTDVGTGNEVTPSISWEAGDQILAVGATEDEGATMGVPTATGLTFSQLDATAGASNTRTYLWGATAGANGSGAVTSVSAGTSAARGLSAYVYRGSDGFGTPASITGSTAKTISVTRSQANSHIVAVLADWNQVGDVTVSPSPAGGTQRVAVAVAGRADFFQFSWGDQGSAGTTAYGITDHTGTVDMSGLAVEIKGTGGGDSLMAQICL